MITSISCLNCEYCVKVYRQNDIAFCIIRKTYSDICIKDIEFFRNIIEINNLTFVMKLKWFKKTKVFVKLMR